MSAAGETQFLQGQGHTPVLLVRSKALLPHLRFVARLDTE